MEETVRRPQVEHEAQRPEDLLLLGRLCMEADGQGEGVQRQVEDPAAAHHLQPHTNNSCRLCLSEKFTIMLHQQMATLNHRNELYINCNVHKQNRFLDKTLLYIFFWYGTRDALFC